MSIRDIARVKLSVTGSDGQSNKRLRIHSVANLVMAHARSGVCPKASAKNPGRASFRAGDRGPITRAQQRQVEPTEEAVTEPIARVRRVVEAGVQHDRCHTGPTRHRPEPERPAASLGLLTGVIVVLL